MRVLQRAAVPAVLAIFACFCQTTAPGETESQVRKKTSYPQHILIIRHAEKTGAKDDIHLSRQGKDRAAVLEQLFTASRNRPRPLPTPDFIFAATHHKDSQRPVETVTPLARKLKLPINDQYDSKLPAALGGKGKKKPKKGMEELRDEILGSAKYSGKTILVAWRHKTIPQLARTLKAGKVPEKWDSKVFDRVWQITYNNEGNTTFHDLPQRLLRGDAAK